MCLSEGGFRGRGIGESWATFLGLFLGGGGLIFSPFPSSFNFPLLPLFVPYYLTQGLHQRPLEIATKKICIFPGNRECAEHCRSCKIDCCARME